MSKLRSMSAALAACLVVAALLVAGCGGDDGDGGSTSSGGLDGARATFLTFGAPFDAAFKKAWTDPLSKRTGLEVAYDAPTDYAKVQVQVESKNVSYTVVEGDPFWSKQQCGEILEALPAGVEMGDVDPKYVIDDCQLPGLTFVFLGVYDAKKFGDDPPTTWADFFDTAKYPGKRGIYGSYAVNGTLEGALQADGVAKDDLYPLDLDRAFGKLDTIRDEIKFFDSYAQAQQLMESGEISMAVVTQSVGYATDQAGADWGPINDGAVESWDAYVVPKGADAKAATAILNEIVSPRGQRAILEELTVGTTLKELSPAPKVPQAKREWSPVIESNRKGLVLMDQTYYAKAFDEVNTRWTDWVAGN